MPGEDSETRRNCIPIIHTRGTHYEVGFDVGRTFSGIIQNFLKIADYLQAYLRAYETPEGRKGYEDTLNSVKNSFPQYIRELEGVADGAGVPFHQLFLLHMDDIILAAAKTNIIGEPTGCSTICINENGNELLGHTEDALACTMNHYYFVSAHIISEEPQGKWGVKEEKFTSLCYAGHLPGYTMSYNHHGLVFSINTLSSKNLRPGKIPRYFITRALLAAKNFVEAQQILRDTGCGVADGCSVNMTFLKQEGDRVFHNAEIAPPLDDSNESRLNILTISPQECIYHVNSYLRLKESESNERMLDSSIARLKTFEEYKKPKNKEDLKRMLSDIQHNKHRVFRSQIGDHVKTICVGIFDLVERTLSLYSDRPIENDPIVVLPLDILK
ncbi:hypothetical protein GWI33_015565 [Rhynchophorus ferrugineus]|uniref:Peptidase C45 hydrolase domain-containing protein n=1 Tax=Rhynchophorus ferrugineus TaxID=354439 RepID=A0A834I2A9_RHYFE|nr:hypothetical protein GWI33_015565 [Rhynchophorus ferrugineus]